jgi:branched-chain amino acid transport system permease protein
VLSAYTQHWMAILGPLILIIALTATRGVWGLLPRAKAQGVESRGP